MGLEVITEKAVRSPPRASAEYEADGKAFPWYDAYWLNAYERAKAILSIERPAVLPDFLEAFRVLHTPTDFRPVLFEHVFDDTTLAEIRKVASTLAHSQLEFHEAAMFKRFVVHNHAFFNDLQAGLVSLVSKACGEPVEVSYNFLSLYGPAAALQPHLDAPEAKWTLDFCIDQSSPWPIYFSRPRPWPELNKGVWGNGFTGWADAVKLDTANQFEQRTLQPGQAILFSGSSQWHYREAMPVSPGRQFCDLLFFHFFPTGSAELVKPANWARLFDVPELETVG